MCDHTRKGDRCLIYECMHTGTLPKQVQVTHTYQAYFRPEPMLAPADMAESQRTKMPYRERARMEKAIAKTTVNCVRCRLHVCVCVGG